MSFNTDEQDQPQIMFSLNDIFERAMSLDNTVFRALSNQKTQSDIYVVDKEDYDKSKYKYYQIKILRYKGIEEDQPSCKIMRIIDVSDKIMFHMAVAEKKLQALFNATVSHDMRDPTNSIHC